MNCKTGNTSVQCMHFLTRIDVCTKHSTSNSTRIEFGLAAALTGNFWSSFP